jgi:hypothetical protein
MPTMVTEVGSDALASSAGLGLEAVDQVDGGIEAPRAPPRMV